MMEKDKLIEIYENTVYEIPELNLKIKINSNNIKIDEILKKYNKNCWAFITADNPFSINLGEAENEKNFVKLKEEVKKKYIAHFVGFGRGQDNWGDEKSLLIIGIPISEAISLGKLFGQNAILVGNFGCPAEVKWIND